MKLLKKKKGFTIVELVIVIGVIGILAGILIPTFVNVNQKAEEAALKSNLASAYSSYVSDAADGVIDEPTQHGLAALGAGEYYTIELKAQNNIVLKKGEKTYKFKTDGWGEEAVAVTTANSVALQGETRVDVTYGGYNVYYVA